MAECWDPAQLLQIQTYARGLLIQCVGHDIENHGARCRRSCELEDDDDLLIIYEIMDSMAQRPPWEVKREELTHFARICLCRKYHRNQRQDVVEAWAAVLEKTAAHYNRCRQLEDAKIRKEHLAKARVSGAALQELDTLLRQKLGKGRFRRLHKMRKAQDNTSAQSESTHHEDRNMLKLKNMLRIVLDDYNDKEDELQQEPEGDSKLSTVTEDLSASEAKVEKLRDEKEAELRSCREETAIRLQQEEVEHKATRDRLTGSITEANRTLAEKNAELEATQGKLAKTLSQIRDLEATLQAAEDQQRQVESELATAKVDALNQVTALQEIIHQLQANISACWLHRFKKWLKRTRRVDD